MSKLVLIVWGITVLIGIGVSIYFYVRGKIELKAEKKKEKQNAKIDKETLENINVVAGDDVHVGNDILHQLAEKRK